MFFRRSKTPAPETTAQDPTDEPALPQRLSPRSPGEAIKPTVAPRRRRSPSASGAGSWA